MHIGYARLPLQASSTVLAKLEAAGCEQVVIERGSANRRALERALRRLGEGDVLIVPALDSLASTLSALLSCLHEIDARGASLRSLADEVEARYGAACAVQSEQCVAHVHIGRQSSWHRTRGTSSASR